jgi:hypothetical protein
MDTNTMTPKQKKEVIAISCGMTVEQLLLLVKAKKLAGKTLSQIERELEQIAWARHKPLVFVSGKGTN